MKLLRLKITDPNGFRSLQTGFEYHFRTEWQLEEELKQPRGLTPFVCAGPNGSGKSNLLEALAAIFFQLEVLRVRRSFLPDAFFYDEETNPDGINDGEGIPDGFELEYLIRLPDNLNTSPGIVRAHVVVAKLPGESPQLKWINPPESLGYENGDFEEEIFRDELLPKFVLGYSSGENEILSLPFFKMRFIQYDEYWNALKKQFPYPGRPDTRLAFLDSGFSQAILLSNLLYNDPATLRSFHQDVGVKELNEFRIIIKRRVSISDPVIAEFGEKHPALRRNDWSIDLCLAHQLEADKVLDDDKDSNDDNGDDKKVKREMVGKIINRLERCATCHFTDLTSDTLYLDYYVNDATRQAFRDNFDFEINKSPIALFQAFQVLLSLNLYSVSDALKAELYKSKSAYVSETVPTLASDERIMRFKFVKFTKEGVDEPVMLKSLSDGEHQLLHSLGLCLLFKNTNSLFLLDEPETHFNPDWRSSFITRLRECFADADDTHEMLITTHSPFLISDTTPDRVLVFEKEDGKVQIEHPDYNTFGASVNKITLATFGKRETIGGRAQAVLAALRSRFADGESSQALIDEIYRIMGDSVERTLLIKSILDQNEEAP